MAQFFTSPIGRFVQGDAFEAQTKDAQGAPLTVKTGPNAGQPTKRWFMAVAFPKNHPETLPYLQKLAEIARAAWPQYFNAYNPNTPPLFGCSHPRFSLKVMDGDGMDDNGKPNASKPGFAGHWIVKYSSSFQAPEVYNVGQYDPMQRVTDARALQRGYRVRMFASSETNDNDQRPGIYVNLGKVEISAIDEVIQTGPTAEDAFGSSSTPTPAAPASPAPAAPTGGIVATGKDGQTIEGLRQAGWTDDQMVATGYATRPPSVATPPAAPPAPTPPAAPPAPSAATPSPSSVQPYGGYMQTATPPAAPQDTGGAPAGFRMLPAAQGATYQMMLANGWTDDTMRANGMMGPL